MKPRPNVRFKVLLMEKGLTQRQLSMDTKIPEDKVSRLVRGYVKPEPLVAEIIADYLGVSNTELFSNV